MEIPNFFVFKKLKMSQFCTQKSKNGIIFRLFPPENLKMMQIFVLYTYFLLEILKLYF
jgi:hypothetical protein